MDSKNQKIVFDPKSLKVESFSSLPERKGTEGTAFGYSTTDHTCAYCTLGCCGDGTNLTCI